MASLSSTSGTFVTAFPPSPASLVRGLADLVPEPTLVLRGKVGFDPRTRCVQNVVVAHVWEDNEDMEIRCTAS